ncbi:MAG: hypothetical protein RR385_10340 [Clostridiales bacterium]
MENIYEIMAKAGVEIPDDKKAEIDKAVLSNYKTVAEVGNITAKLNTRVSQSLCKPPAKRCSSLFFLVMV